MPRITRNYFSLLAAALLVMYPAFRSAHAKDLRITFPLPSKLTPVQRLNREGVKAARRHHLEKAESLFYKAYLYDPSDPFTLNNLGYAAELKGDASRAEKFYDLASEQDCNAVIVRSSVKALEGKPMMYALEDIKDTPMLLNRMNVEAIVLLAQDRGFEAGLLLRRTLKLDPANPFTLNNLGVAEENTGDLADALRDYTAAADARSQATIVVTAKRSWRGRQISTLAAASARRVQLRIEKEAPAAVRATMLTVRGVAAINQNDWQAAKQDFLEAHALNPNSAFTLNNLGYVAERGGDPETAQFYYDKARTADDAKGRVGLTTAPAAQGQRLVAVATDNRQKVSSVINQYRQERLGHTGAPRLIPRGAATPTRKGAKPAQPSPQTTPQKGSPLPQR